MVVNPFGNGASAATSDRAPKGCYQLVRRNLTSSEIQILCLQSPCLAIRQESIHPHMDSIQMNFIKTHLILISVMI